MRPLLRTLHALVAGVALASLGHAYTETFDTYATGSQIIGQGGWQGWDGNAALNATVVGSVFASAPNSLRATGQANVVRQFAGYTSGRWVFRAKQFVPSSSVGEADFVLFNRYRLFDHPSSDWSVELAADAQANTVRNLQTGDVAPLVKDAWVEIRCEIDLDTNHVDVFYNGALLSSGAWTTGGILQIQAVQAFALDPTSIAYYDDIRLEPMGTTDVLAPFAEQFLRGQPIGGTLASWAADDGDARTVQKFFVVNQSEAFLRINLSYVSTTAAPTRLRFETKARMLEAGAFRITLLLRNKDTGQFEAVMAETGIGTTYTTFVGEATGSLGRFVDAGGVVTAQVAIRQAGPSATVVPRAAFETALVSVTR